MVSAFFCPTRTTEVTQEGVNTGAFLFPLYDFVPHLPPAVLSYSSTSSTYIEVPILWREGFGRPFPSSTMKLTCAYSRSFSAFYRFLPPDTKVRKNPLSPRFEPVTWVPEGYLRGCQLDNRGDRHALWKWKWRVFTHPDSCRHQNLNFP